MKRIGVVTTSRADYSCYLPILRKIVEGSELALHLLVSGSHLSEEQGHTIEQIEADGFPIGDTIPVVGAGGSPRSVAEAMGGTTSGFAVALESARLDIMLVLGDRFEMHAACSAAVPFQLPIAHIHGGELTMGAMDDAFRHGITKMAHLHFVSTPAHGRRVIQLGEEPWRVTVSGAPSLDNLKTLDLLSQAELSKLLGFDVSVGPIVVTFHPETKPIDVVRTHTRQLLDALKSIERPVVVTGPNLDPGGAAVRQEIDAFVTGRPGAYFFESLGPVGYFSLLRCAGAMVGNSSSGMTEAASFRLPVVNVGDRQEGRTRAGNVIDVENSSDAIAEGLRRALDRAFAESLDDLVNPYGDGMAADRIVEVLAQTALNEKLLHKRFHDLETG